MAAELARCAADPAYFIDAYGVIDDAQGHGEGAGTMPFRLWPAQRELLADLHGSPKVLILKARQLGISWLCCGYVLWSCLFRPGQLALLFSKGQDEANELLRRVRVLYDRLPEPLRDRLPRLVREMVTALEWDNGSRVRSLPATKGAGRTFTASLIVLDEMAHMQWARELYSAAKATVNDGGQFVGLSSANGVGNLFHQLWARAAAGADRFRAVFLPWTARPGRDDDWYAGQLADSPDPDLIRQEYPANPTEAFVVSGRTRFHPDWVADQDGNLREPLPAASLPAAIRHVPGLAYYADPVPGRRYAIGADVAEGLEGGDYSAAVAIDRETRAEVASVRGRMEPDEYADALDALGRHFDATVAVERNNHGHAVLLKLNALAYPKVALGHDGRPGWLTNSVTKPVAIDALAVGLRDGGVTVRTRAALAEMQVYAVGPSGSTGAPAGYHDDFVMAWATVLGWMQMGKSGQVAPVTRAAHPLAGYRGGGRHHVPRR